MSGGRLDAGGARLRLRALHVMGHGSPRLARALGVRKTTIQELVSGKACTVSPHLRDATSICTKPGGTSAPPNAPAPNAPQPPPPANAPLPETGVPQLP
jgi:hypothetical protein